MFNLTKLDLLWDWVGDLKKRIIPLEEKIPKDYSTTETATGQKWIDGKDIFCKVITGVLPVIETTSNVYLGTVDANLNIIDIICILTTTGSAISYKYASHIVYNVANGVISQNAITSSFSEGDYKLILYYTKPDPTPGRAPECSDQNYDIKSGANDVTNYEPEPEEKKTTKKKTAK